MKDAIADLAHTAESRRAYLSHRMDESWIVVGLSHGMSCMLSTPCVKISQREKEVCSIGEKEVCSAPKGRYKKHPQVTSPHHAPSAARALKCASGPTKHEGGNGMCMMQ